MMKQTPSPVKRLWELTGTHRRAYALSIILAILGVACGMIPYFAIAYIMLCLIDGVTALNTYAVWCGVILLGFTLKLLFSTLSTTVSHTATFQTLKEVRIKIADKLSRVPMGYIMDQSSGRFKDVIVDRVESMEPILAHLVPEMTSNLFVPLCMVAHRLYTVTGADQLVVVNQGRIEATGTHEELLKKCPLYKEMWKAHIGSRDEGGATA